MYTKIERVCVCVCVCPILRASQRPARFWTAVSSLPGKMPEPQDILPHLPEQVLEDVEAGSCCVLVLQALVRTPCVRVA